MDEHRTKVPVLPGEDLGRGGEASAGPQAGPAGEQDELQRGRRERPATGPVDVDTEPPTALP
ncbi:MAG: hypothetical protein ACK4N5_22150 [Myxococcales bacterium]